jgi:hypothetical protein
MEVARHSRKTPLHSIIDPDIGYKTGHTHQLRGFVMADRTQMTKQVKPLIEDNPQMTG